MQFCSPRHALTLLTRTAGILTLAAIFACTPPSAFGQTTSSYALPPLIAAPTPSYPVSHAAAHTVAPVVHESAPVVHESAPVAAATPAPVVPAPAVHARAPAVRRPPVPVAAKPTEPATPVAVRPAPAPATAEAPPASPPVVAEHTHAAPPIPAETTSATSPVTAAPTPAESIPPSSEAGGDIPAGGAGSSVYHIGVDDVLNISVWQEPDLSRTVPVRPDGKISLPLVGDVQAAGKSAMQLQGELKLAMAKFVRNPELTVIVVDIRSRRVNVMGEVARPGTFPLTQSMGVLEALAAAGGLRDFAKKKDIYVLRMSPEGKRQRLAYSYEDVLKGKTGSKELMLQPRDTVVVP
jgi:polysaccharide export outer membrane protein